MKSWTKEACENIDATIFNGDEFHDEEYRKEFQSYLERWNKKIIECAELGEHLKTCEKLEQMQIHINNVIDHNPDDDKLIDSEAKEALKLIGEIL